MNFSKTLHPVASFLCVSVSVYEFLFLCFLWETKNFLLMLLIRNEVFEPVEKLPNMELKAVGKSLCFSDQFNLTRTGLFTCGKVAKKGVELSSARNLNVALICYRKARVNCLEEEIVASGQYFQKTFKRNQTRKQ